MADDLDAMLQGDDTSSGSPTGTSGQPADSARTVEQQAEEEVWFNSQSGSIQDRVRELWREKKLAEERASFLESNRQQPYVPPAPNSINLDQKQALDTLASYGVATDEKVDQRIAQSFNQLRWDMENQRLENKFPGTGKLPKYDKGEVEDYIRSHPNLSGYSPEDVFMYKMYPDEFRNEDISTVTKTGKSQTLKPTKQVMISSEITPENVEEMVRTHSQEWYEEHIEDINRAVNGWTKQFNNQGERV